MAITIGYTTTRVVVNTHELFEPGGSVHRWSAGVSRQMHTRAIALAPPRRSEARWGTWATGRLARSIKREVYADAGNIVHFSVWAEAPYAKYVHEGTADDGYDYIYTNTGWANRAIVDSWIDGNFFQASGEEAGYYMPVTRIPDKTRYFLRVRGQKANPFLADAYRLTRRQHSGLPAIT